MALSFHLKNPNYLEQLHLEALGKYNPWFLLLVVEEVNSAPNRFLKRIRILKVYLLHLFIYQIAHPKIDCNSFKKSLDGTEEFYVEEINGKCYLYSNKKFTFSGGRGFCRSQGGKLAEPKSLRINSMIFDGIPEKGLYWIGIKKDLGRWRWDSTHLPVRMAMNWGKNQPNSGGDACVYMYSEGSGSRSDSNCSATYPVLRVICEL